MIHEGPDSLLDFLQKKGLCISLMVRYNVMFDIAYFHIQCNTTDAGMEQADDVINFIFQVRVL